jgi:hypothetical protein
MKKTLFFIPFLILFSKLSCAQTNVYHPMLNESYWYMRVSDLSGSSYFSYLTIGDTLIGNQGYKLIKRDVVNNTFDTVYCLREDIATKTVFMWNGSNDVLLYSFDLGIGSYVFVNSGNACSGLNMYQVNYIDSVQLGFGFTNRFLLSSVNQSYPPFLYIIEGVGSIEEPIQIISCTIDPSYSVDCNSQNGLQIYGNNCSQMPPPNSVQNSESTGNTINSYWISSADNQFILHSTQYDHTPVSVDFVDITGRLIASYSDIKPGFSFQNLSQNTGMYLAVIRRGNEVLYRHKIMLVKTY